MPESDDGLRESSPVEQEWLGVYHDAEELAIFLRAGAIGGPQRVSEELALRHAVSLDAKCVEMLANGPLASFKQLASEPRMTADSVYEVRAAMSLIPHCMPFRLYETDLRADLILPVGDWPEIVAAGAPEALATWRKWLHAKGTGIAVSEYSLLSAACSRLASSLTSGYQWGTVSQDE